MIVRLPDIILLVLTIIFLDGLGIFLPPAFAIGKSASTLSVPRLIPIAAEFALPVSSLRHETRLLFSLLLLSCESAFGAVILCLLLFALRRLWNERRFVLLCLGRRVDIRLDLVESERGQLRRMLLAGARMFEGLLVSFLLARLLRFLCLVVLHQIVQALEDLHCHGVRDAHQRDNILEGFAPSFIAFPVQVFLLCLLNQPDMLIR